MDLQKAKFAAWPRETGRFGIRNHVVAISSVSCANFAVEQLARRCDGLIPITHQHGCTHLGDDRQQVLRTLAGTAGNPNVGAVLIIGLGCESTTAGQIAEIVATENRMVDTLVIQQAGSVEDLLDRAERIVGRMRDFAASLERIEVGPEALTIGLECGGSDPFSGITANPTVGLATDALVDAGATVILSETTEMIGAEDALLPRIERQEDRDKLLGWIARYLDQARVQGCDLRGVNPTPGNIRAGLSSIEEKSLGCICKGGSKPIVEVIDYAERPGRTGLVLMNTPGNDPESITGMVAGGANCVLFTTGVGTPLGNPVAPVIKIASNSPMASRMASYIDLDAGRIIGGAAPQAVADELLEILLAVAAGQLTLSERNGCREFAINRIGATY
ncbi:MAG: UxaA family hydrolase [Phycisphaerae bacterium]